MGFVLKKTQKKEGLTLAFTLRKARVYTGILNTRCRCQPANKTSYWLKSMPEQPSLVDSPQHSRVREWSLAIRECVAEGRKHGSHYTGAMEMGCENACEKEDIG